MVQYKLHQIPVVIKFGSPAHWQPESMIHQNPVVNEFGSESAAQSIIHWKPIVIELGSECGHYQGDPREAVRYTYPL